MFEEVVEQKIVKRMLENEYRRGSLPQTLLFYGPEHTGKFYTAIELARILNCTGDKSPGCSCPSCRTIKKLNSNYLFILSKSNLEKNFNFWNMYGVNERAFEYFYMDVMRLIIKKEQYVIVQGKRKKKNDKDENTDEELENKGLRLKREAQKLIEITTSLRELLIDYNTFEENKDKCFELIDTLLKDRRGDTVFIDEIRFLISFLHRKMENEFGTKVVIIDGADYMNEEAANSFLKISEDTPPNSLIIMTAVDKSRIKPTIISRSRLYKFVELSMNGRREVLKRIFGENFNQDNFTELEDKRLEEFIKDLNRYKSDYGSLIQIIKKIVDESYEVKLIDRLIKDLAGLIRDNTYRDIKKIYYIENRLKRFYDEKAKLKKTNVNRELSFTNFILNDLLG